MEEWYGSLLGPGILFLLMIVVGLQLVVDDFRRVLATPRAVVGGTLGQLILLPLMTWGVVVVLDVAPMMAAGAVLLAATPGAGMSNVMAAVARANVALSVTLTAVSSLLAVVSLPVLASIGLSAFVSQDVEVEVPVGSMIAQLASFVGAPIGIGMLVRARRPEAAQRYIARANRFAVVGVLILTVLSATTTENPFPTAAEFGAAVVAALLWTGSAMAIGWGVASLLRITGNDRFTFVVEFAARNLALTVVIALASFGSLELGLFAIAYSLSGFPAVIVLAVLRGRHARRVAAVEARSTSPG